MVTQKHHTHGGLLLWEPCYTKKSSWYSAKTGATAGGAGFENTWRVARAGRGLCTPRVVIAANSFDPM